MRVVIIVLLFFISSCGQHYNDLIDYGYKGRIRKAILIDYLNPDESSGEWIADKEPRFTKTIIFNDDGMAIEESFALRNKSYTRRFTVKGGKRTECNETGDESGHSRYTYTDSTITELEYDSSGSLILEAVTSFNKERLTTKEEYKYYNDSKTIIDHTAYYYIDRVDGYVNRFFMYDSIANTKTSWENVILGKDEKNNPTKILRKKDGLPESLRVLKFEYK